MKSSHRRVSRALVTGVGSMIVLGVVFWLGKLSAGTGKSASDKEQLARANAASLAPVVPSAKIASTSQPSVVSTATTQATGSALLLSSGSQLVTPTATT